MRHLGDELTELALGTLGGEERARAIAHVAACPECRAELAALEEALAGPALALSPVPPPPPVAARLLASAAAPGRFAFADLVARVFDLSHDGATSVLASADDPARWEAGPIRGLELLHLAGGPAVAQADSGLVRFAPGTAFPRHRHIGLEVMVVLEGGFTDDRGEYHGAGERLHEPPGSSHAFVCDPVEGCLAAVVLFGGIEIDGRGRVGVKRPQA